MEVYSNLRVVRSKLPVPLTSSEYDAYYSYYYLRNVSSNYIGHYIPMNYFTDFEFRIVARFVEEVYIDFTNLQTLHRSMINELIKQDRSYIEDLNPDLTYVYISNIEERLDSSLLFSTDNADEFEAIAKLILSVVGSEYKYIIFR